MEDNFLVQLCIYLPCTWQIVMFVFTGIIFEFALEDIKAKIFPNKEGGMPPWMGGVLGWISTIVYLLMAYAMNGYGLGWTMLGGIVFAPVYAIAFYYFQLKGAMPLAKLIYKAIFKKDYVKKEKPEKVDKPKSARQLKKEKKQALKNAMNDEEFIQAYMAQKGI